MSNKLLQHVYTQLRDAAERWSSDHPMSVSTLGFSEGHENENGRSSFWIRLKKPAREFSSHFRETAEKFLKHCEDEGLIGDLVPAKITVTPHANHYDIEGEDVRIGESLEEAQNKAAEQLIAAYNKALTDAINGAPDAKDGSFIVPPGWQDPDTPEKIEVRTVSKSDKRRAILMNRLRMIVHGVCGPLDPVQAEIEDFDGDFADIHLSIPKLTEATGDLLTAMAREMVEAFKLAEESFYEDQGKKPSYTINLVTAADRCMVEVKIRSPDKVGIFVDFSKARKRLWRYLKEYIDEQHIIKPRISGSLGPDTYTVTFTLNLNELKEETDLQELSISVMKEIAKKIDDHLRARGAANNAKVTVGVSMVDKRTRIYVKFANRTMLTQSTVERSVREVLEQELPADNILGLKARYAINGTAGIVISIQPT